MDGLYLTFAFVAVLAIILPHLLYLIFPSRREAFSRSAWFAFAPLIVGICGVLGIIIFVLTAGSKISPGSSAGLAGAAIVTTYNLLNGYRSVTAWWKNRH